MRGGYQQQVERFTAVQYLFRFSSSSGFWNFDFGIRHYIASPAQIHPHTMAPPFAHVNEGVSVLMDAFKQFANKNITCFSAIRRTSSGVTH
jgi:hypothetical protein